METLQASFQVQLFGLGAALGIGLLVGIERERSKGQGPEREVAGVRTFTLASLSGAVALTLGEAALLLAGLVLGLLVVAGYRYSRQSHPGITTETALLLTFLLGAWATRQPAFAGAVAVIVTIVLAARSGLHRFVHHVLTDREIHDGLLLAAAALVVLPLVPAAPVDPWGAINLRKLWMLVVLLMGINALGYVALRTLGGRRGLPLAGLISGFVSSTATIGAMGARAKADPDVRPGAVAGGALSSIATVVQLFIVIGLTNAAALRAVAVPLAAAGIAALAYGAAFTLRGVRAGGEDGRKTAGRPFDPKTALLFMLVLGAALVGSALLTRQFGSEGLLIAAAFSGLADAHAAAISAVSVAGTGNDTLRLSALGVLTGLTTNSVSKTVAAFSLGDRAYAWQVVPGILAMVGCAWGAWAAQQMWLPP